MAPPPTDGTFGADWKSPRYWPAARRASEFSRDGDGRPVRTRRSSVAAGEETANVVGWCRFDRGRQPSPRPSRRRPGHGHGQRGPAQPRGARRPMPSDRSSRRGSLSAGPVDWRVVGTSHWCATPRRASGIPPSVFFYGARRREAAPPELRRQRGNALLVRARGQSASCVRGLSRRSWVRQQGCARCQVSTHRELSRRDGFAPREGVTPRQLRG
jgi:hypothetical protein